MTKENLQKIFDSIIENYDKFNIHYLVEPQIEEYKNWDGKGKRFIKYIRMITLEDKESIEQEIK